MSLDCHVAIISGNLLRMPSTLSVKFFFVDGAPFHFCSVFQGSNPGTRPIPVRSFVNELSDPKPPNIVARFLDPPLLRYTCRLLPSGFAAHSRREAKAQASLSRASGSASAYFAAHANSYLEVIKVFSPLRRRAP